MSHESIETGQSPDETTVVSISSAAGLIASVPAVLGFTPRESVVVLAQHGSAGRGRLGAVMRADLPRRGEAPEQLAAVIPGRIAATGAEGVHLVLVTEHDLAGENPAGENPAGENPAGENPAGEGPGDQDLGEGDLPQAALVATLRDAFAALGMAVCSAFWLPTISRGAPWRCYGACRCAGVLPDPGATEAAAHQALLGKVTFSSREDAEDALAPTPGAVSARARQPLDAAHDRAAAARARNRDQAARDDLEVVRAAAVAVGEGRGLDEHTMARVAVALRDPAVRDVCLGFVLGADPVVRDGHAEQLWWAMTRATPAPEVAEPATLLAFAAVVRGGGAQVRVALDRAHAADPGHRLSGLIEAMLERGVRPAAMRDIAARAAAEAAAHLTG